MAGGSNRLKNLRIGEHPSDPVHAGLPISKLAKMRHRRMRAPRRVPVGDGSRIKLMQRRFQIDV